MPVRGGAPCAPPWSVRDDPGRYGYLQEQDYTLRWLSIDGCALGCAGAIWRDLHRGLTVEIARDRATSCEVKTVGT